MMARVPHQNYEQELIELGGLLHTRRLVEMNSLKSAQDLRLAPYEAIQTDLSADISIAVCSRPLGQVNTIQYVEGPPLPAAESDDAVDVKVKAVVLESQLCFATANDDGSRSLGRFFQALW
ncbi:Uu.00g028520.m01.CDS01 [Anthostomella pinea]|uniref:Uu.00g028520.m01.CDS01 n=1 Tax=Anthostomella pinea TaxID=933095 RepID=A0AAI8V7X3_9PEZI|nr:Uu.00g028520.m01.CDS01 [Anthostomella pinea]